MCFCSEISFFALVNIYQFRVSIKLQIDIKMSFFKGSKNIENKEGGPDRYVSNNRFSSVTLNELSLSIMF